MTKHSTCTQYGECSYICYICELTYQTSQTEPTDHYWSYENDGYVCVQCGLKNANGASGDVVFEDLTYQYGNGENYVVGYWVRSKVEFTYYVSLLLLNVAEGQDNEVFLKMEATSMSDISAFVINKATVASLAAQLGYSEEDYLVKFTFVPYGADGSFDYAIVFAEDMPLVNAGSNVTGTCRVDEYVTKGETFVITIVPEKAGHWYIRAYTQGDTWAELGYYYEGKEEFWCLAFCDDYYSFDSDFYLGSIYLEAGATYELHVGFNGCDGNGDMMRIDFEFVEG